MQTKTEKRQGALARLQAQLDSGVKTAKNSFDKIPLDDADKARIKQTMSNIKAKI